MEGVAQLVLAIIAHSILIVGNFKYFRVMDTFQQIMLPNSAHEIQKSENWKQ